MTQSRIEFHSDKNNYETLVSNIYLELFMTLYEFYDNSCLLELQQSYS